MIAWLKNLWWYLGGGVVFLGMFVAFEVVLYVAVYFLNIYLAS